MGEQCEVDSGKSWTVALIASLVFCGAVWFFKCSGVLYVALINDMNLSRQEAMWPLSIYIAFAHLVGPVVGFCSTQIKFQKLLVVSTACSASTMILMSFASTVEHISFACVILGMCNGFPVTILPMLVATYFKKYRTSANGILYGIPGLSSFFLPVGFKYLMEYCGLQRSLQICGALHFCFVPAAYMLHQRKNSVSNTNENENKETNAKNGISNDAVNIETKPSFFRSFLHNNFYVFKVPWYYVVAFSFVVFSYIYITLTNVMVDFAQDHRVDPAAAVLTVSVFSAGDVAGRFGSGWITDHSFLERRSFLAICYFILGLLCCVVPFIYRPELIFILLFFLGWVLGGIVINFTEMTIRFIGLKYVAVSNGWIFFIMGMVLYTRPLVIGFFRDTLGSYDMMFTVLGFTSFFMSVIFLVLRICGDSTKWFRTLEPDSKNKEEFQRIQHLTVSISSLNNAA